MSAPGSCRVKVCGITRLEDAIAAVEAGADFLGFIFAPSPRRIEPEDAARIIVELPPGPELVGVFVDESPGRMLEVAGIAGLTMLQLHGSEPPEVADSLRLPVIKAVRLRELEAGLEQARAYSSPYLLAEPLVPGKAGGAGVRLDFGLGRAVVEGLPERRVLLAGGLGAHNVREAVEAVRPWGVDASSALETAPGRKDPELIRRYVEAAKGR